MGSSEIIAFLKLTPGNDLAKFYEVIKARASFVNRSLSKFEVNETSWLRLSQKIIQCLDPAETWRVVRP